MCHAILRIAYHHDKARDTVEVEKEEEFEKRLSEVRGRTGVRKVTIFHPTKSYEEVKRWEVTDHTTGVKVNEESNQDTVAPRQSFPDIAEVPARSGQIIPAQPEVCEGVESSDGADCAASEGADPVRR